MKWLLVIAGVLIGLGLIVVLIGSRLPREHQASSRITVAQPIERVWAAIRDFGAMPSYWPGMKTVERLADRGGQEVWKQRMKNGDLTIQVTESVQPERLVTTIDAPPGSPFGGRWIYRLEAIGATTRITVTEDGWIDNKFFRVVSKVTGYHGTLDSFLTALSAKLGSPAAPEHVGS